MKKSIFIIITVLLMFNPYTVYAKHTHQTQSQTASISISLDDLKDDGQYQYNGLKWKSKLKDVKKEIPYTLKPLKYENLSANYDEWFETQCDNLRQLYGEETSWNINYSSITKMKSQTYRWDLSDTTLQLIMMTGETINPSATLGIAEF